MRSVSVHRCALGKMGFPPSGEGGNTTRGEGSCQGGRRRGRERHGGARRVDTAGEDTRRTAVGCEAVVGFDEVFVAPSMIRTTTIYCCMTPPRYPPVPVKNKKNTGARWYRRAAYSPIERN